MTVRIIPMTTEDDAAAFREFHAATRPGHYLGDPEMFGWSFGLDAFAVAWAPPGIVGYTGRVRAMLRIGERLEPCAWHEATWVAPGARGQGLGERLHAWSTDKGVTGNIQGVHQPAIDRILDRIFPAGPAISGHMERALLTTLAHAPRGCHRWAVEDGDLLATADLPANMARQWEFCASRYGVATERNRAHLRWRFVDHPRGGYRIVMNHAAVAIVREEVVGDHRGLRIVDLWGEESAVPLLLADVVALASRRGATFVDFVAMGSPDRAAFEAAGFTWLAGDAMTETVPLLFAPLDPSPRQYQVRLYGQALPMEGAAYITRADNGLDRPGG